MNFFQEREGNIFLTMTRNKFIIVILFVGMARYVAAQDDSLSRSIFHFPAMTENTTRFTPPGPESLTSARAFHYLFREQMSGLEKPVMLTQTPTLGWFCRKELILEEKTGLPLRFRIGTYQAAARLEGK